MANALDGLLFLAVVVGLPAVGLFLAYKAFCSLADDSKSDLEESRAERIEQENERLRLEMLKSRRGRPRPSDDTPPPQPTPWPVAPPDNPPEIVKPDVAAITSGDRIASEWARVNGIRKAQ